MLLVPRGMDTSFQSPEAKVLSLWWTQPWRVRTASPRRWDPQCREGNSRQERGCGRGILGAESRGWASPTHGSCGSLGLGWEQVPPLGDSYGVPGSSTLTQPDAVKFTSQKGLPIHLTQSKDGATIFCNTFGGLGKTIVPTHCLKNLKV